jgi:hypothetical protein
MNIIAVDPGANGGIVTSVPSMEFDLNRLQAVKMPATEGDVLEVVRGFAREAIEQKSEMVAVVESQTGGGGKVQRGMFKFGRGYGFILGVLHTLGIRIELVAPQKWQKELGLGKRDKNAPKTEWKNKLKARAQQLFPAVPVTLATADALLLLEYYRRTNACSAPEKGDINL